MLNQNLSQKLLQKLTPQQIQLMKLLQVPTVALEQRIKEELEINPALEEGDNFDSDYENINGESNDSESYDDGEPEEVMENNDLEMENYFTEDDEPQYKYNQQYSAGDDEEKAVPIAVSIDFHDYLMEQLNASDLDNNEYIIGEQIVGSIDDDGYLRRDIDAIIDDIALAYSKEYTNEQIIDVLTDIQNFDPVGVGARDLQECLLIQLNRKENKNSIDKVSIKIITSYYDEFIKKHYEKLQKTLDISDEVLKQAIENILNLNPKPASGYSGSTKSEINYIIPDFSIYEKEGELELTLNGRNAPDLRISDSFKEMIQTYKDGDKTDSRQREAVQYIKQKIDAAKWFIDAIKQRQQTLMLTMRAILDYQYAYFKSGDERDLKPMILKDIADLTGLDISTISRVANSKYVETEFGVIPLKFFFSESLTTDSGEDVSTHEVKKILSDEISKEDKKNPLSDQELTELLQQKGYNIARRTIAKYREQLNLPVARLRKEL